MGALLERDLTERGKLFSCARIDEARNIPQHKDVAETLRTTVGINFNPARSIEREP